MVNPDEPSTLRARVEPAHARRAPRPAVPPRAVLLSLAALAVPAGAQLLLPENANDYELLLWLLALLPAFLLAYYKGWRGGATAFAGGMAVLSLTQAAAAAMGQAVQNQPLLLIVVAQFAMIAIGVAYFSELLHRAREEAEARALIDELTGLPNRRFARLVLEREFEAAIRGRPLAAVMFDLDHFKAYNDRHGHAAGDEALRVFAAALARGTRKMELSARLGGEEFVSILSSADADGVLIFVERVRGILAATPPRFGPITVSSGVAVFHPDMTSPDELLAAADAALYEAKAGGRDTVRVYGAVAAGG